MAECPFLKICPIWADFAEVEKMHWLGDYCRGDKFEVCERRKRGLQGLPVTNDLLPDGSSTKA